MANNYQQFSTVIPHNGITERRDWLLAELAKENGDGYAPNTYSDDKDAVWVYAEECGDIGALVEIVAAYQKRFHLTEPWVLTWADWCDKLRVDEFSGGAVAVLKGTVKWIHPSQLADAWIKKQQRRKPRRKAA